MGGLEDLGKLWRARQRERGLQLIDHGSLREGVEVLEGLGKEGFGDLNHEQRLAIGEACLLAAKHAQGHLKWSKALVRFRAAARLLPPRVLLQERIHALQRVGDPPEENPEDPRVRASLELSPGRVSNYEELLAVDETHALGRYVARFGNTPLTERIRDMKRRSHPVLAQHFAGLLAGYVSRQPDLYEALDLVVPTPPDPEKFARRGYGPTDLMLEPFCHRLGLPFRLTLLSRTLGDEPTRAASPGQVLGTIRVNKVGPWIAEAQQILLLEDVVVAGKNVNACAIRLKEVGVKRVMVLALATTSG